ncbi:5-formyltetrahydrofolate cyclo-ligase [Hymenobacter qilianensis]|uniref:5-formyltetrahydrofolate cyclo-ligase n=2 Tax=Hymenobacter qilianensis TaxID=1385715 RepID=A0ACB5PN33_9BACT|nr:5-formyltetrahydrofolate cyclo-ligase [Hymenobacter qilianensis]QNP53573.1 5-formyltetrahydrofolate cyclo-ligase [Hymenobacter qilianensis]GGF55070.1 5-formyltetrahydrofolate cyclo-ligase [Hymenobacter qilianensis]
MLKADIRRNFLARRRALSEVEVQRRSEGLGQQFFSQFPVADWHWLHLFLPISKQHEPDTWLFIRRIWDEFPQVQLAVPVTQADGQTLRHYLLMPDTQLATNRWGIPEPVEAEEMPPSVFDAVLVPLLACDLAGHRVGYGKGFYDRFLAQCRPETQRIGLSLEPLIPQITDVDTTDEPLTACITPEQVFRFR